MARLTYRHRNGILVAALSLIVALVLAACGGESTPVPPTVTAAPPPTATVAVVPVATATAVPTATPVPTSAPVPTPTVVTTVAAVPTATLMPEPTATPEPTPEPTSTPTQEPTATPTVALTSTPAPTATPEPTSTATPEPTPGEAEGPVGISGREVMAMLTEEERGCIRDQFGEELLGRIGGLTVTSRLANDPNTRFIFECIKQESVNRIGLALITVEAGLSVETAACIFEVIANTPNPYALEVGRIPDDIDFEAAHVLEAEPLAIRCLSDEEALATFAQMNVLLDGRDALRGNDVLAMLSSAELECAIDLHGRELLRSIGDSSVMESFRAAEGLFGCIEPRNLASIFARVSASRMGGLSAETVACAEDALVAAQERDPHPHLVEFTLGVTDEAPEHYDEAVSLSREIFGCMSDVELLKLQRVIAESLHGE